MSFGIAADAPIRPATQPAPALAADEAKAIDDAIADLGAADFAVREQATRKLWSIGEAARRALLEAGQSENPEISRRARGVLASFAYGIGPETPQEVIDEFKLYRQGGPTQRKSLAGRLSRHGVHGARVLLKLADDEEDPQVRQVVINALGSIARTAVPVLLQEDDAATAEQLLALIAPYADYAARDHAAFLLLHGGIDRAIADLQRPADPSTPPRLQQLRLAYLHRAKGEYLQAAPWAEQAGDQMLHGALMADAGKYAELAAAMAARGVNDDAVEEIGFITAFYRLAGNAEASDHWAKKLVEYAHRNPSDHGNAVEALMLNEKTSDAIDLLLSKKNHLAAADYLALQLDFKRLQEVVDAARNDGSSELPRILCRYAQMQHFQGDSAAAEETMHAIARGEQGQVDFGTWVELVSTAPGAGIAADVIEGWIAQGLVIARQPGELSRMFAAAGFVNSDRAQQWWVALRDHRAGNTPAEALALVRKIDRKQLSADDLATLLQRTKELAGTLPRVPRHERLRLVADTLAESDRLGEAVELSAQIAAESATAENLTHLGELRGKSKDWEGALDAFMKASEAEPTSASTVALSAWATKQLGRAEDADRLIQRAHLMPLGNETARHALAGVLAEHGMKTEALKERELTARLGDPISWEVCDSIRQLADEAATTDALAAAKRWDRAFLANLTTRTMFVDASANLSIPVLIRRTKAVGRIKIGDIPGALAEAEACLRMMPSEADAQIAIINELDKAGHKAEADALYKRSFEFFKALQQKYPDGAPANNLVAWLCGSVKRDLDYALACARKANELEPKNTAILDTLSEVHFARGELDEALEINRKCRELEPHIQHHKDNFERFTKAKAEAK